MYAFYRAFSDHIPLLNLVIWQVLSHRSASTTAESTFSLGGNCLNDLRTALLTLHAEGFSLSSSVFKMQHGADRVVRVVAPKLP